MAHELQNLTTNSITYLNLGSSTLEKPDQPQPIEPSSYSSKRSSTLEKPDQPQLEILHTISNWRSSTLEKPDQPQRVLRFLQADLVLALWKSQTNRNTARPVRL